MNASVASERRVQKMSPNDQSPTATAANRPPQEIWLLLDAEQQQHVFQMLVRLCRHLLQTTLPQPETPEVDHA
jgi:hypothetical protein